MKVVAFVPLKLNNERLPGKNTRTLDTGEPLFSKILQTLLGIDLIDETYVFCSSESIRDQLPEGVRFLRRSESLDTPTTLSNDFVHAFAEEVEADIYILAFATAPFTSEASIRRMLSAVQSGESDSAMAVVRLQEFFWENGAPSNFDLRAIPRTQDLNPVYMETTGLYVFLRALAVDGGRRVGDNPLPVEVSKIEAIDINEPDDFVIANAVNTYLGKP